MNGDVPDIEFVAQMKLAVAQKLAEEQIEDLAERLAEIVGYIEE